MNTSQSIPSRRAVLAGAAIAGAAIVAPAGAGAKAATNGLKGTSVLITGCSSGFGRLMAEHFALEGATVIASMRNLQGGARPEAKELAALAKRRKLNLSVIEIDVTSDEQVASGVVRAEAIAGGALDVVVNNAGVGAGGPAEVFGVSHVKDAFDVNFMGSVRVARAALPKMRERRQGLIVQVSSQLGRIVLPAVGVYCATKHAVEAMFETMAYELAPFGVDVSIVQPGGYPTRIWANSAPIIEAMLAETDEERRNAYAAHLKIAEGFFSGGGTTDPMDVPRAIAEIIAAPPGKRPLRRPVHPVTATAVETINAVHAEVQARFMSQGPYKAWHDAVAG